MYSQPSHSILLSQISTYGLISVRIFRKKKNENSLRKAHGGSGPGMLRSIALEAKEHNG